VQDVQILPDAREVRIDGAPVTLGARAFDVLAHLHANRERVVSKAELLETVWGGLAVEEGNLTVQISALRKVLGAKAIATVPGVGYKLALGTAPAPATGPALPDKPSLAVLPFVNLTGRPEQDYLVDGIVTDLISALSGVSGLFVIAATSSFAFKGQTVDLAAVGTRLGVRYLLEGAIQQAGDALRITVQLVEAETGRTIWSDRFTGSTAEVFDLQDRITEMVCGVMEPTLIVTEAGRVATKPTESLAAYDLCLRAVPLALRPSGEAEFRKAVDLLNRAIAFDPGYALAKAWTCRAYLAARASRWVTKEEIIAIDPLAAELLQSHRQDPLVLAFAAFLRGYLGTDRSGALHAIRFAVKRNRNSVLILNAAGWMEHYALNFDAAIAHFSRAVRLDPLGHVGAHSKLGWGYSEFLLGQHDSAAAILEDSFAEEGPNGGILEGLIVCYWYLGRKDEARALVAQMLQLFPDYSRNRTLADVGIRDPRYLTKFGDALAGAGLPE
jgi:TolB-like protein/Tfp pilus assembly protein PilF